MSLEVNDATLDRNFISSLFIDPKNFPRAVEKGVSGSLLLEYYERIFAFILEHFNKYSEMPSQETVELRYQSFAFIQPEDTLDFYIDTLKERKSYNDAISLAKEILEGFNAAETPEQRKKAIEASQKKIITAASNIAVDLTQSTIQDITKTASVRYAEYKEKRDNPDNPKLYGIPTPWQTLNEQISGFLGGDLITFLGESGLGKTWVMLLCLAHAFSQGYRVLLFTEEMTIRHLAGRFDAMMAKVPAAGLKHARLNALHEKQLKNYLLALQEQSEAGEVPPFYICQGVGAQGAKHIPAIMSATKPNIVGIDGGYLLAEDYNWQSMAAVTKIIKGALIAHDIPGLLTNQKSSSGSNPRGGGDTKSAFGPNFKNDSSVLIEVYKEKELELAPFMRFKSLKGRDMTKRDIKWITDWDFEEMRFGERPDMFAEGSALFD